MALRNRMRWIGDPIGKKVDRTKKPRARGLSRSLIPGLRVVSFYLSDVATRWHRLPRLSDQRSIKRAGFSVPCFLNSAPLTPLEKIETAARYRN